MPKWHLCKTNRSKFGLRSIDKGIVIVLLLWVGAACTGLGKRDIRDYYFPLKSLTEGLVYEYQTEDGNGFPPEYRYYRSFIGDGAVSLTVMQYDQDLLPLVFTNERLVRNGMKAEELLLLYPDGQGKQLQVSTQIESADVFPFRVEENGGIYLFRTAWEDPMDSSRGYTLIQNRYFDGDTSVVFQREKYPAVRFLLREGMDDRQEGVLSLVYEGKEVYAKGLGLVYYEKEIADGLVLRYRLADRYKMEVLEARFKEMMDMEGY